MYSYYNVIKCTSFQETKVWLTRQSRFHTEGPRSSPSRRAALGGGKRGGGGGREGEGNGRKGRFNCWASLDTCNEPRRFDRQPRSTLSYKYKMAGLLFSVTTCQDGTGLPVAAKTHSKIKALILQCVVSSSACVWKTHSVLRKKKKILYCKRCHKGVLGAAAGMSILDVNQKPLGG